MYEGELSTWKKQINNKLFSTPNEPVTVGNLRSMQLGDEGVDYLIGDLMCYIPDLKKLYLSKNNITIVGALYLSTAKWEKLQEISLYHNNIQDMGVKFLIDAQWQNLTLFQLGNNKIGNIGLKYLTKGPWSQLKKLCLQQNQINDDGIVHLSKGLWLNLQILHLQQNKIGNKGINLLTKGNWKLTKINLISNKFTIAGNFSLLKSMWKLPVANIQQINSLHRDKSNLTLRKTYNFVKETLKNKFSS